MSYFGSSENIISFMVWKNYNSLVGLKITRELTIPYLHYIPILFKRYRISDSTYLVSSFYSEKVYIKQSSYPPFKTELGMNFVKFLNFPLIEFN